MLIHPQTSGLEITQGAVDKSVGWPVGNDSSFGLLESSLFAFGSIGPMGR